MVTHLGEIRDTILNNELKENNNKSWIFTFKLEVPPVGASWSLSGGDERLFEKLLKTTGWSNSSCGK